MKIEISARNTNSLLSREEVSFVVKGVNVTPSKKELREKLSALTNAKPETVVIERVASSFGSNDVSGLARIYKDKAAMKKVEQDFLVVRNFGKEEKPAEAAAEPAKENAKDGGTGAKKPEPESVEKK